MNGLAIVLGLLYTFFGLAFYVYSAICLMLIAKKPELLTAGWLGFQF